MLGGIYEISMPEYVCPFKLGQIVTLDLSSTEMQIYTHEEKLKYWGELGYGQERPKFYIFIADLIPATGHCVLADLATGEIKAMWHTDLFRAAEEREL